MNLGKSQVWCSYALMVISQAVLQKCQNFKKVIAAIRCKLTGKQLLLFKSDIFGHFMELDSYAFNGVIIHNILLRQVAHEETDENKLWSQIRGHSIRLSIREWCLVIGLSNGLDVLLQNLKTQHRVLNKYFDGRFKDLNLKQLDAKFVALNFRVMDDALKITLYYFADRVLNKRKDYSQDDFQLMNYVDDIDRFRTKRPSFAFSWVQKNVKYNLHSSIKISSPIALSALQNSYPSSAGSFRPELIEPVFKPMLDFLYKIGSFLMVNAYPFFAYESNTDVISLDYALFRENPGVVVVGNGFRYFSLFDAQINVVFAPLSALKYDDIRMVVTETGWSSKGDENEIGASIQNAVAYNGNLVRRNRRATGEWRQQLNK
ncbi:glucan endo-1,3-beta-D-glucosidase [Citrus sinensis]|nr:glucan endo-1,3-beta-D-glucosidase [Citrus sinensis]